MDSGVFVFVLKQSHFHFRETRKDMAAGALLSQPRDPLLGDPEGHSSLPFPPPAQLLSLHSGGVITSEAGTRKGTELQGAGCPARAPRGGGLTAPLVREGQVAHNAAPPPWLIRRVLAAIAGVRAGAAGERPRPRAARSPGQPGRPLAAPSQSCGPVSASVHAGERRVSLNS